MPNANGMDMAIMRVLPTSPRTASGYMTLAGVVVRNIAGKNAQPTSQLIAFVSIVMSRGIRFGTGNVQFSKRGAGDSMLPVRIVIMSSSSPGTLLHGKLLSRSPTLRSSIRALGPR